jgi:adenylylsulfate kinase
MDRSSAHQHHLVQDDQWSANIREHKGRLTRWHRWNLNNHKSFCLWITGLSAAGKSTLAFELEERLFRRSLRSYVLDGDNIRHGLSRGLGFSTDDRRENLRRAGEVARLFLDAGIITIAAFVSPSQADRQAIRQSFQPGEFIEIYLKCDLEICMSRDPKGLYRRALAGEIAHMTGISDMYEVPEAPEITVETDRLDIDQSVKCVLDYLSAHGYVP